MSTITDVISEDDYEDWKQIDGIFASMGVDGELSEESFLKFLHKDKQETGTIGSWLADIGLGQYENVLIINGFDNIEMLNGGVLEESDLHLMGFSNIEDISKMIKAIAKLPAVRVIDASNPPLSVSDWLSSLGLSQYLDNFNTKGFNTMSRVQQIWELELASVLSVVLLGHQKRILVSLGDDRPGFNTIRRKQRNGISDISKVVKVNDVKINGDDDVYFKHNFQGLQSKYQVKQSSASPETSRSDSPAKISLERSDSGCSIGSDGIRPDVPDRHYNNQHESAYTSHDIPMLPPKKNGTSLKYSSPHSSPILRQTSVPQFPSQLIAGQSSPGSRTLANYSRSQSAKQLTKTLAGSNPGYLTMDNRNSSHSNSSTLSSNSSATLRLASDFYVSADYANLTETGTPLIGNVDGLKLSKAQSKSKRVLSKFKRPLPDLPPGEELTFTVADLPLDFKGKHRPDILINGCVNYSACYLGTCLVKDITGPESTREAIAKMKSATEAVTKLPVVTLSVSYKGVDFIDASSKRPICEHEITNIYCAAQDSVMMNYFAYITKDVLTKGLYCHVFCTKSEDLARDVILTLGEAFDIAFYAVKKHPSLLDP